MAVVGYCENMTDCESGPSLGAVPHAIERLSKDMEEISGAMENLSRKLEPLLRPQGPASGEKVAHARQECCDVARRIFSLCEQAEEIRRSINFLTEHVDL